MSCKKAQNCAVTFSGKCDRIETVFFSSCSLDLISILAFLQVDDNLKAKLRSTCDFYYDKMYLLPYTSFVSFPSGVFLSFSHVKYIYISIKLVRN